MSDIDLGVSESIKNILENAEKERYLLLGLIEYFLNMRFPIALESSIRDIKAFEDIAESIGTKIESGESIQKIVCSYEEKLKELKSKLNKLELTGDEILHDFSVEDTQQILKLIEPALEEQNNNLINSVKKSILEAIKQKSEQAEQMQELKEKRAYLQGKLDNTSWRRKKYKATIQDEINSINEQINELEKPYSKSNAFQEMLTDTTNNDEYSDEQVPNEKKEDLETTLPSHEEK